uniref:Kinesin-like protein n=1 Tax=Panagrolaimus davidi TaxID=227884 RepID=A0A914PX44_9BILA
MQEKIYETIAQPIVGEVLGGKNGTIFVYGQTGSGKTSTMNGNKVKGNTRGIIVRSIESIFEYLNDRLKKDPQFKFLIKCSYIEVYKKVAFDLLQTDGATIKILASGEQINIVGAAEFVVTSVEECLRHLQNGWNNRKTAKISMNPESSRSHAIFMLTLVTEEIKGTFVNLRTSRLNFVDLAGSERQSQTNNIGERLKEGACINQDLLFLATVIRDLGTAKEGAYIPYRNCSLTHLLRDSLGGNSITAVIVTVHPNLKFVGDTLSTLNFAENCKKVKNKAKVNEAFSTKDVEAWKAEKQKVQDENVILKEENVNMSKENQQLKERMEKCQKKDADTILILQNEKKTLKAEAVKYVEEVNEEKQNLQTQISLLEKNVAEQKEQINALENTQKEASELQLAQMKKEYDLKTKEIMDDLKHEKDALQKIKSKLNEYKLLVAEKNESIEKSKNGMDAKILEYETLLEKTVAEQKEQEKNQKETYELQIARMKKEYDLKIRELMDDLKKANEKVVVVEAEVQTDHTGNGSADDTVQQLPEEYAELLDPTRACNLADVIVNGEIDYELLNGQVLFVEGLTYFDGKCKITILFSDYKKLTGNKISVLSLDDLIVNDENGIKVEIDKLWKEVKNVRDLTHKFANNESMHEMAQKLVELAPFPNLYVLCLKNVQDGFDLQSFHQFYMVMFMIFLLII